LYIAGATILLEDMNALKELSLNKTTTIQVTDYLNTYEPNKKV